MHVVPGTAERQWRCAATCTRGLEDVLAGELAELGASPSEVGRGIVRFAGGPTEVYRANLWLRSAVRVLVELTEGAAGSREALYALAHAVPWEEWLVPAQTIAVSVAGQGAAFPDTRFAALTVKDGLVDRLRSVRGGRPDVDRRDPDVRVWVHLAGARAALGLDASGEPLSHRGYRPRGGPAPLAESLAAGALLLTGYRGAAPFLDPMCGTGTLAIEAALIATLTAPGLARRFACERWLRHDRAAIDSVREQARAAIREAPAPIVARDADARAVAATRANARLAGVGGVVRVERGDARRLEALAAGTLIVTNPPYGERMGRAGDLAELYRGFGDALWRQARGCTAWMLIGDPELIKAVPLRPSRRVVLFNGPIECRLVRYDIHEPTGQVSP